MRSEGELLSPLIEQCTALSEIIDSYKSGAGRAANLGDSPDGKIVDDAVEDTCEIIREILMDDSPDDFLLDVVDLLSKVTTIELELNIFKKGINERDTGAFNISDNMKFLIDGCEIFISKLKDKKNTLGAESDIVVVRVLKGLSFIVSNLDCIQSSCISEPNSDEKIGKVVRDCYAIKRHVNYRLRDYLISPCLDRKRQEILVKEILRGAVERYKDISQGLFDVEIHLHERISGRFRGGLSGRMYGVMIAIFSKKRTKVGIKSDEYFYLEREILFNGEPMDFCIRGEHKSWKLFLQLHGEPHFTHSKGCSKETYKSKVSNKRLQAAVNKDPHHALLILPYDAYEGVWKLYKDLLSEQIRHDNGGLGIYEELFMWGVVESMPDPKDGQVREPILWFAERLKSYLDHCYYKKIKCFHDGRCDELKFRSDIIAGEHNSLFINLQEKLYSILGKSIPDQRGIRNRVVTELGAGTVGVVRFSSGVKGHPSSGGFSPADEELGVDACYLELLKRRRC